MMVSRCLIQEEPRLLQSKLSQSYVTVFFHSCQYKLSPGPFYVLLLFHCVSCFSPFDQYHRFHSRRTHAYSRFGITKNISAPLNSRVGITKNISAPLKNRVRLQGGADCLFFFHSQTEPPVKNRGKSSRCMNRFMETFFTQSKASTRFVIMIPFLSTLIINLYMLVVYIQISNQFSRICLEKKLLDGSTELLEILDSFSGLVSSFSRDSVSSYFLLWESSNISFGRQHHLVSCFSPFIPSRRQGFNIYLTYSSKKSVYLHVDYYVLIGVCGGRVGADFAKQIPIKWCDDSHFNTAMTKLAELVTPTPNDYFFFSFCIPFTPTTPKSVCD
ncbi:hypothetical protein VP01_886g2 [Puccinia sorghi]|uniref:Uncharacterized protein n=1 Tax=Puccinia sorghi TaxID=27349 RepID=A0A0L6U8Y6_9BASI|nr:hypothetical protein VP01_886g2 [Puccinia sorghi]